MDVGARLKQWRESRRLTQQQLALRVGMSASQLCRYEQGRLTPRVETLGRLAHGLGIHVRDLFW
jgi:transcriptional regulator with XRE-family HTH domain